MKMQTLRVTKHTHCMLSNFAFFFKVDLFSKLYFFITYHVKLIETGNHDVFVLFDFILYVPVNNLPVMSGQAFLG